MCSDGGAAVVVAVVTIGGVAGVYIISFSTEVDAADIPTT